jgi:nitrogen regulatory protein P-II 1
MKMLNAVFAEQALSDVRGALKKIDIVDLTVTDVKHYGKDVHTEQYRGDTYTVEYLPKVKVEAIIPADRVEDLVAELKTICGDINVPKIVILETGGGQP